MTDNMQNGRKSKKELPGLLQSSGGVSHACKSCENLPALYTVCAGRSHIVVQYVLYTLRRPLSLY